MSERMMCKVRGLITLAVPESIGGADQTMLIADKEIREALKNAGLLIFDASTPLAEVPVEQKSRAGHVFSSIVGIEEARPLTRAEAEVPALPILPKEVIE